MASLAGAAALFPQLSRRKLDQGPFVFALTDLYKSNILVDDEWHITAITDLEFACSWPTEFIQPPYWLGGEMLDEIRLESFSYRHEEFIRHIEQEELPSVDSGREPLSTTMRQGWSLGMFWATLSVIHPIAFTEIFYYRIIRGFMGTTDDELRVDRKFSARFWCRDINSIIEIELKDHNEYNKELDLLWAAPDTSSSQDGSPTAHGVM